MEIEQGVSKKSSKGKPVLFKLVRSRLKNLDGIVAIEFALILPVFILLLGGVIDFGVGFFVHNSADGVMNAAVASVGISITSQVNGGVPLNAQRIESHRADLEERAKLLPDASIYESFVTSTYAIRNGCTLVLTQEGNTPFFILSTFVNLDNLTFGTRMRAVSMCNSNVDGVGCDSDCNAVSGQPTG